MIRHLGAEPPWTGVTRYGSWVEREPLWDGTAVWEYREPVSNWFQLLSALPFNTALSKKVEWLEDQFLPTFNPYVRRP